MTYRKIRLVVAAAAILIGAPAWAAGIDRDEFKTYLETRDALQDERVLAMPEAQRIPRIASVNFKMKGPQLQAILDKVEAAGGEKGVAENTRSALEKALAGAGLEGRIEEVRIDTSAPHVVTYIKWKGNAAKIEAEASLIALKAGEADPIASTFFLWAVDEAGQDVWRAKIGADRTKNIREERIEDWAKTRYVRLFEVDRDNRG